MVQRMAKEYMKINFSKGAAGWRRLHVIEVRRLLFVNKEAVGASGEGSKG